MSMTQPRLHFEYEYDERLATEAKDRGHLGGVIVELADGSLHPVFFYDPVRLVQDFEEEIKQGRAFLAERGMIIVSEVTLENMQQAVTSLEKEGFFRKGKDRVSPLHSE